ncbi:MAG: aminoglycoside phosphotransferase family protein [Cyanobium sp.]
MSETNAGSSTGAGSQAGSPPTPRDAADDPLVAIAEAFALPGPVLDVSPLGAGNVNDTYRLRVRRQDGQVEQLVLQRINTRVFPRPELVLANMLRLGQHVQAEAGAVLAGRRWEVPRPLAVRDQPDRCWLERDGAVWRTITFVEGCRSCEVLEDRRQARELGRGLGTFHALISDLPVAELADTLKGFHITPAYLLQFERALRTTNVRLSPQAAHCIAFIRARERLACVLEDAKAAGRLQLRPIHGDPKLNNVLFDQTTGEAIALVDLDTIKPGLVHYDIGDCLRSGCNRLGEETADWRSVHFDLELCEAILEGYLGQARAFLADADYDYLYEAIRLIAFELGLRFFTDHLGGNFYFRTDRPGHNLQRALVQFRLTESIETQEGAIRAIVERLRPAP